MRLAFPWTLGARLRESLGVASRADEILARLRTAFVRETTARGVLRRAGREVAELLIEARAVGVSDRELARHLVPPTGELAQTEARRGQFERALRARRRRARVTQRHVDRRPPSRQPAVATSRSVEEALNMSRLIKKTTTTETEEYIDDREELEGSDEEIDEASDDQDEGEEEAQRPLSGRGRRGR